jgi:hypothetical protein
MTTMNLYDKSTLYEKKREKKKRAGDEERRSKIQEALKICGVDRDSRSLGMLILSSNT